MAEMVNGKTMVTTAEIRRAYIGEPDPRWDHLAEAEFDRWLTAHDAEVAVKALEDAQESLVLKDAFTERSLRVIDEQIASRRATVWGNRV